MNKLLKLTDGNAIEILNRESYPHRTQVDFAVYDDDDDFVCFGSLRLLIDNKQRISENQIDKLTVMKVNQSIKRTNGDIYNTWKALYN